MKNSKVLDCTLRDGGLALEDAKKNQIETDIFSADERNYIAECLVESHAEIIELGSIEENGCDRKGFGIYESIEELSAAIPAKRENGQMFCGLFRGPDKKLSAIPDCTAGMVEAVRLIVRYSELQKSLDYCKGLTEKGYKVFIQPMVTCRYTEKELDLLIESANHMGAYALYIVDSYGFMTEDDVAYYFTRFDKGLESSICIGFHAHNNMGMAFANVRSFIKMHGERQIIVDSCADGMGQGAGNMQTEVLMDYLNRFYGKRYSIDRIYDVCEVVEHFNVNRLWGYAPARFISAANGTAYKYADALRRKYGLEMREINHILKVIPEEMRYRFTEENMEKLLTLYYGKGDKVEI